MNEDQLLLLKRQITAEFVPHLPPLLRSFGEPQDTAKNTSRAFAAFVLKQLVQLDAASAGQCVVDDLGDNGIDAVYYHQHFRKLYLFQTKIKANEPFGQSDSLEFVAGVRDLLNQHYDRFNDNVVRRRDELEHALDDAEQIVLVIAYASSRTDTAATKLREFLSTPDRPDERLADDWIEMGPGRCLEHLLAMQAVPSVDDAILIHGVNSTDSPRRTYYGQVLIRDLVALYERHGTNLLEKNIRHFLGPASSSVNRAIHETLDSRPDAFFYLSNGVTAIAREIEVGASQPGGPRKHRVQGLSVINGAQTIASSHHFSKSNPTRPIDAARVLFTLIQVDPNDGFGAEVTWARNHQNPVTVANFAALDPKQERLRRELVLDGVQYRYRPEAVAASGGANVISVEEAALALAALHPDPGMPVTAKREPARLLDRSSPEYDKLFTEQLSGKRLVNAVRLHRAASAVVVSNELASSDQEELVYRHGRGAIIWLVLQANQHWLNAPGVITESDASSLVSGPVDAWRQKTLDTFVSDSAPADKGPLAFFRTRTTALPFLSRLRTAGLPGDPH